MPYPVEINDSPVIVHRQHSAREFCDMMVDQFDWMIEECKRRPLVCNISIHPYVFGQPFRMQPLLAAFKHCVGHKLKDRVWFCRPCDIAEYCYTLPPGIVPGS